MMIYTAKLNKKLLFSVLAVIIIVILALIFGLPSRNESMTTMANTKLKNEAQILEFVKGMGYTIDESTLTSKEAVLPRQFDETYEKYNELQKSCGFDLEKYKGKTVTIYTVEASNHPDSDCVLVELMLCKNKLIGGSVYTKELDGFMHGLEKPKTSVKN